MQCAQVRRKKTKEFHAPGGDESNHPASSIQRLAGQSLRNSTLLRSAPQNRQRLMVAAVCVLGRISVGRRMDPPRLGNHRQGILDPEKLFGGGTLFDGFAANKCWGFF